MATQINPAFNRWPVEGALVGRILSSFGEIEVTICRNAALALNMFGVIMRMLYGIRATSARIEAADRLMRSLIETYSLINDYKIAIGMVWHCLKIRNQFAHCNWGDHLGAGLFFADLQDSANNPDFDHSWKHVDPVLLQAKLDYFWQTMELLEFIHHELAVRQGRLRSHVWPRPTLPAPPALHNPPDQHVPPWLGEDQKALHLARARAAQGGAPTPTPKQKALDKVRADAKLPSGRYS
jgi:hypothetical protein